MQDFETKCRSCGEIFGMRELDQVLVHEHHGEPTPESEEECGCRLMGQGVGERVETFLGEGCSTFHPPGESEPDVTERPPVSGVDTTVERESGALREVDVQTTELRLKEILNLPDLTVWPTLRTTCADALSLIHTLQAENEGLREELDRTRGDRKRWRDYATAMLADVDVAEAERDKLREVLQWCAEQVWEGGDIEVGDFQDAMVNAGLLVEVEADEDFKAEWDTEVMYVLAWSPLEVNLRAVVAYGITAGKTGVTLDQAMTNIALAREKTG